MQTPVYVVVGMHRAGTSAVARGLMTLGISLGDNLMPPAADNNETGFWEDMDLFALNEEVLAALGESVNSVRLFDERKLGESRFRDLEAKARTLLAGKLKSFGAYGFKDPRTSRLLPFWQRVFRDLKLEANYVVVTRNPISVAHSLHKRNGFSAELSHVLWLEHMLPALHWTADCRRVVVDYDRLMEDPAREIERMRIALQLPRPPAMKKRLADYSANFLTERLRHTHFDSAALREAPGLPAGAVRLHRLLLGLASDEIAPDDAACADEVRRLWSAMTDFSPVFALAERGFRDSSRLRDAIGDRDARLDRFSSEISAQATQIEARDDQLRRAAGEALEREQRFAAEAASREQRIATLEATIMARDAELHRVGADAALREQRVADLEGALGERDGRLARLSGDLDAAARRMADLETEFLKLRHDAAGRERRLNQERARADQLAKELEAVPRRLASEWERRLVEERAHAERLARELESVSKSLSSESERSASLERFFAEAKASLDEQIESVAALRAEAQALRAKLHERSFRLDSIEAGSFWRATAPARRAWQFAESILARRRDFVFRLVPNAELQPAGGPEAWRSIGGDPHFQMVPVGGAYPCGWVLIRSSLQCASANRGVKLYMDAGDGMPEHTAIRVPVMSAGSVLQLVRLPPRVTALRWDPMDAPGPLSQQPVNMSEVGPVERRMHMLSRVWNVMRGLPLGGRARHGLTWRRMLTDLDGAYRVASELLGEHPPAASAR